jgi:RNA recognition motif-containing protein
MSRCLPNGSIYVCNLPPRTDETTLAEYFGTIGLLKVWVLSGAFLQPLSYLSRSLLCLIQIPFDDIFFVLFVVKPHRRTKRLNMYTLCSRSLQRKKVLLPILSVIGLMQALAVL